MSPTQKKTPAKKATTAAKRRPPRRRSASKAQRKREVTTHPFPPGTEVGVYPANDVSVERSINREPFGDPISKATVTRDGSLEVTAPRSGTFAVAAEVNGRYEYVTVSVAD